MAGTFDTYGQISPLAISLGEDDSDTKQMEGAYMKMMFSYEDQKRAIYRKKQQEIEGLGKTINAEHELLKNNTFISPERMKDVENDFQTGVEQLKNHYKVPGDQRGVEWYRNLEQYKKVHSPMIDNDAYNRGKYDEIFKLYQSGDVNATNFYEWRDKFMSQAQNGDRSTVPDPPNSRENLMTGGWQSIKNHGWKRSDLNPDLSIKKESWDSFVDNELAMQFWPDAEAKIRGMGQNAMNTYYQRSGLAKNGDTDEDKKTLAVHQYIREMFKDGQFWYQQEMNDYFRRINYQRSEKTPKINHWAANIGPAMRYVMPEQHDPISGELKQKARDLTIKIQGADYFSGFTPRQIQVDNLDLQIGDKTYYCDVEIPSLSGIEYIKDPNKLRPRNVRFHMNEGDQNMLADVEDLSINLNEDAVENVYNMIKTNGKFRDSDGNEVKLTKEEIEKSLSLEKFKRHVQAAAQYNPSEIQAEMGGSKTPRYTMRVKSINNIVNESSSNSYNNYITGNEDSSTWYGGGIITPSGPISDPNSYFVQDTPISTNFQNR